MPVIFAAMTPARPSLGPIFGPGARPTPIPKRPDFERINRIRQHFAAVYALANATRAVYKAAHDDRLTPIQKLEKSVEYVAAYANPKNILLGFEQDAKTQLEDIEGVFGGAARYVAHPPAPPPVVRVYKDPPGDAVRAQRS